MPIDDRARSSKVPPSGFGYPLDGVSLIRPWKCFSTSNAHGFLPSEPFSDPMIVGGFRYRLSAFTLFNQTSLGLIAAL
jgi:hypothetical protein